MTELLVCALVLVGSFFMLVSSIGVLRLADFYQRVHAPTKAATLGLASLLLAAAVWLPGAGPATKAILALGLLAGTATVGSLVLVRAAYRCRVPARTGTRTDEYEEEIRRRTEEARRETSEDVNRDRVH